MSESATKSTTDSADFPGPWMKSIINIATLCGVVYDAADERRKARVEGREVTPRTPKGPLEEVMSQAGLDVPDLEALLARLLGGTPDAQQRAAEIVKCPDQAKLLQDLLVRFAKGESPVSDSGASTEPPPATPQPEAPVRPPLGAEAPPAPAPGPVFHPPRDVHPAPPFFAAPAHPQTYGMPMHPHAMRPSAMHGMHMHPYGAAYVNPAHHGAPARAWIPEPSSHMAASVHYRPEYDTEGYGPPPGWRPPPRRPPAPPRVGHGGRTTHRPGWTTFDKLPTRARPRSTPDTKARPTAPVVPPPMPVTPPSDPAHVPAPDVNASDVRALITWMVSSFERFERRMFAELGGMSSDLKEALARLDRVERSIEVLEAKTAEVRRPIAENPGPMIEAQAEVEVAAPVEVETIETTDAVETIETTDAVETIVVEAVEAVEIVEAIETIKTIKTIEAVEAVKAIETIEAVETIEAIEAVEVVETIEPVETIKTIEAVEAVEAVDVETIAAIGTKDEITACKELVDERTQAISTVAQTMGAMVALTNERTRIAEARLARLEEKFS